jgi:hypothetical protein
VLTTQHPSIHKKLALTSPTSGRRSRTQAMEFFFSCGYFYYIASDDKIHFQRRDEVKLDMLHKKDTLIKIINA